MNKKNEIEIETIVWIKDAYIASINYKDIDIKKGRPRICFARNDDFILVYNIYSNKSRGQFKRRLLPIEISKNKLSYVDFCNPIIIPAHIRHNGVKKLNPQIIKFMHETIFTNFKYEEQFLRGKEKMLSQSKKIKSIKIKK